MNDETCDHDLSAARQKIVHDVNVHGWHVMQVLPEQTQPGWSYSIGLFKTFRHPEVVVFGLPLDTMHQIINMVGGAVKSGRQFADGVVADDLLKQYACTLRAVQTIWHPQLLGFATWFYGSGDFPALQLFWPDKECLFPWQQGFNVALRGSQPLLVRS
jgi:hypothetical protein